MTRITFVEANGSAHELDVKDGQSAIEAAVWHSVPGIPAELWRSLRLRHLPCLHRRGLDGTG